MSVYAESSAVLSWLLNEDSAPEVRRLLGAEEIIVASDLTLIECDRVLLRAVTLGDFTEAEAADRRAHLVAAASHWHMLRIAPEVVDRARQPFPGGTDPYSRRDPSSFSPHRPRSNRRTQTAESRRSHPTVRCAARAANSAAVGSAPGDRRPPLNALRFECNFVKRRTAGVCRKA